MPTPTTRIALRLAALALLSSALVHCAPRPSEPPAAPAVAPAPQGAVVGSPNPAMLALLVKARAK